jgi:dolichol kinase
MKDSQRRKGGFLVVFLLLILQIGPTISNAEAFSTLTESSSISFATKSRWPLKKNANSYVVVAARNHSAFYAAKSDSDIQVNGSSGPDTNLIDTDGTVENRNDAGPNTNRKKKINTVIATLVGSIVALVIGAKTGVVHGPLDPTTGLFGVYTDGMILRDVGSTVLTTVLAFLVVKLIAYGYENNYYSSKISRKLSHTLLAPFFMIAYPIFSPADGARYFAAVVTLVNAVRLYLAATSEGESSLARSVSRSGDKAEALGGPFIYVCLLSVFIVAFWRSSMIGIVAASTMAAGDGMADLVGRKWGKNNKWWFSESKSVAGTAAFTISASLTSYGLVNWLQYTGCLEIGLLPMDLMLRIVAISVTCSILELLPIGDDNFTVPLTAAALAAFLLH